MALKEVSTEERFGSVVTVNGVVGQQRPTRGEPATAVCCTASAFTERSPNAESMASSYLAGFLLCFLPYTYASIDSLYCPEGWQMYEGACFMVTRPKSWYLARNDCNGRKGSLAFFDSTTQFRHVTDLLVEEPSWIGLYSSTWRLERNYSWVHESKKPSFEAWDVDQPSLGSTGCVAMQTGSTAASSGWQDESCSMKLPFICQRKKQDQACGGGYIEQIEKGLCYHLSGNTKLTWFEAKAHCKTAFNPPMELVNIQDESSDKFIRDHGILHGKTWIGMYDPHLDDVWQWASAPTTATFTNWRDGQPDDGGHQQAHCATLGCDEAATWTKAYCTAHYPFICEATPVSSSCSDGWEKVTRQGATRCFRVVEQAATWSGARRICQNSSATRDADLVTVNTKDKFTWIQDNLLKSRCAGRKWWFGLNSLQSGRNWTWLNSNVPLNFIDWNRLAAPAGSADGDDYRGVFEGETFAQLGDVRHAAAPGGGGTRPARRPARRPASLGPQRQDDMAVLMLTVPLPSGKKHGSWMNVPHGAHFPALCEIETEHCTDGGLHFRGHCYKVIPADEWAEQERLCLELAPSTTPAKSYLAVINSDEEYTYLEDQLKDDANAAPGVFIGLNSFEQAHIFKFLSNQDKYANISSDYRAWLPGEPHERPYHRCVYTGAGAQARWSDANCLVTLPAVCRRTPLNATVYYDLKLNNSVYKVTHQRLRGETDFDLMCSELLGVDSHLVNISTQAEYQLLNNFLHYEFSGYVDIWMGNFSKGLNWGTPPGKGKCPLVFTMTSREANLGSGDCCKSRYALCEKTIKGTESGRYDVRVGDRLYQFTAKGKKNYGDAQKACQAIPDDQFSRLLTISSPEEYMKLSAELRVIQPKDNATYWIGKSRTWLDYTSDNKFVVRDAGQLSDGPPCLVASLGKQGSRKLGQNDYIHIQPELCDKLVDGYICQSQMTPDQVGHESQILRQIFEGMLTRYFRWNNTFIIPRQPPQTVRVEKEPAPACGHVCVGLAVALPLISILCFALGFLIAKYCLKAGYRLMSDSIRFSISDPMDVPLTSS